MCLKCAYTETLRRLVIFFFFVKNEMVENTIDRKIVLLQYSKRKMIAYLSENPHSCLYIWHQGRKYYWTHNLDLCVCEYAFHFLNSVDIWLSMYEHVSI